MITKVKGTQDFLDLTLYNFILDRVRRHMKTYSFTQISTPILESTDLFKRSLGMQTDVAAYEKAAAGGNVTHEHAEQVIKIIKANYGVLIRSDFQKIKK